MPTARETILVAFRRLEQRTDRTTFQLKEIVAEVQATTSAFQETTLRTYVTSVMCANAPVHHANHTDDLLRVGHGEYQRIASNEHEIPAGDTESAPPDTLSAGPALPHTEDAPEQHRSRHWYWEGEVQGSIVTHLAGNGWTILAVADTESRAHGTDIIASRNGQRLLVEVKGYPSDVYARGPNKGRPKPTSPATQGRVWFASALMTALMLREENPESVVAIGLPDFTTYRSLAERVAGSLEQLDIHLIWVLENGDVEISIN